MTVFANMLEISAKAQGCKVIAAFPDVCFTPPLTPATPPGVPIPYPNFGMDSDLTSGSCTVKIGGQPVSQENSSKYSKCSGDEAGAAPKKGIISSTNMGMMYGLMWSLNVKVDAKGVLRFGDMATSNHSANPGDTPPMALVGKPNPAMADCPAILLKLGLSVHRHKDSPCEPEDRKGKTNKDTFQQSDHIIQTACFTDGRTGAAIPTAKGYDIMEAPCVCLKDASKRGTEHGEKSAGQRQTMRDWKDKRASDPNWNPTYKDAREENLDAMKDAKSPELDDGPNGEEHPAINCLRLECDKYFKDELGMTDDTPVKLPNKKYAAPPAPTTTDIN